MLSRTGDDREADHPRWRRHQRDDSEERPPQESKATHSLGIASIVLGVVALPFAMLPCIGFLSLPLSALGLLLGVVGGIIALTRHGRGIGFPIAGTAISGMAALIGAFWLGLLATATRPADDSKKEQARDSQADSSGKDSVNKVATTGDQPKGPTWASPDKPVDHGDLRVKITKVTVDQARVQESIHTIAISNGQYLIVNLELSTASATKKVDYRTWRGADFSLISDFATLTDNFDNTYKRLDFGLGTYPADGVRRSVSIYPNQTVTEVLVFQVPIEKATHLDLKLPAKNFGSDGAIRFRIPMENVETQAVRDRKTEAEAQAAREADAKAAREAEKKAEKERAERAREARRNRMAEAEEAKAKEEAKRQVALQKAEDQAATNLKYAQKLFDAADYKKAEERVRWILKELPDTEGAKKAKGLLEKLKEIKETDELIEKLRKKG